MDEEMLTALNQAPVSSGDATEEMGEGEDDADGELTPELRMFARELGFETPAKALALKNFVHACLEASEDGSYSETE